LILAASLIEESKADESQIVEKEIDNEIFLA
jgi:hypothetical protein